MKKPIVPEKYLELYKETARNRVLEVLFKFSDKEFSLSDLAKEAEVAKANIGEILDEFQAMDLVKIIKLTKIWRITANQTNWSFRRSKIIYNLNFIYQHNIGEFINDYFNNPKSIILFGSFRWGENISGSDIDIAVESEAFEDYKVVRVKELVKFEDTIGRNIQVHLFNRKNVDINVFNNIANGIVLLGFLEVKK